MDLGVGVGEVAVACAAVLLGALVQGSIGFGLGLLAAPLIALVAPHMLPVSLVLVACPATLATSRRDRQALEREALRWMLLGAVPGTVAGLIVIATLDTTALKVVVGVLTLVGIGVSLTPVNLPVNALSATVAGFLSNGFGTATSVGGPPVALLLQHHSSAAVRATLGAFFAAGGGLALAGYALTGELTEERLVFAVLLAPAALTGFLVSRHLHGFTEHGWLRPAILVLCALAGTIAIVNGLT